MIKGILIFELNCYKIIIRQLRATVPVPLLAVLLVNIKKMKDIVKIQTGDSILINRIASLLEENNITSLTRDNAESARLAGYGAPQNSVELYVNKEDEERALEILGDFNERNEE